MPYNADLVVNTKQAVLTVRAGPGDEASPYCEHIRPGKADSSANLLNLFSQLTNLWHCGLHVQGDNDSEAVGRKT